MTDSVVAEGQVRIRDGKKWKSRWVVLRKPSPVADCLVLLVYKERCERSQGQRERSSVTLEHICGLEPGLSLEGVGYSLAILCLSQTTLLGFDSKEALLAWDLRVRYSLGEVHRFSVAVLPGTKLESGPATLHLCNNLLVIARDLPPVIIGQWNLLDLRRYGPVTNGFVFEGGTRCGYWAGVFFLSCAEGEQISFLFDCIVRGISPSRGPFGLRPLLPDPNASPASIEEQLNHDAQELEKRLSLLSHCSHHSSTASTSSYSTSVAGDDRSISGSSDTSDTSQSEGSIGSRLAIWAEPVASPAPAETTSPPGAKGVSQGEEKLSVNLAGGVRVPAKPPLSRRLQEIGRQSSSDSGIATGSHSSYSGSFSSYAGSLDIIGPGDDFGSVLSLPPHSGPDRTLCTCPPGPGHEYHVPTSLRYLYDTPRSLLGPARGPDDSTAPAKEQTGNPALSPSQPEPPKDPTAAPTQGQLTEAGRSGEVAPPGESSAESCQICIPHPGASRALFTTCPICGGLKGTPLTHSGGLPMPAVPGEKTTECLTAITDHAANQALRTSTETTLTSVTTSHSLGQLSWEGSPRTNEKAQEKGPQSYFSHLSDLLGHYCQIRHSGIKMNNSLSIYEPMASALGSGPKAMSPVTCGNKHIPTSLRHGDLVIYENCFQCKSGDNGCLVTKPATPQPPSGRKALVLLAGLRYCGSPRQGHSSQECNGDRGTGAENHPSEVPLDTAAPAAEPQSEEVSDGSVEDEDKKQRSREERRKADPAYEVMEGRAVEKGLELEEKSKYELMASCGQQRTPRENEGGVFVFPADAAAMTVMDRLRGDGVTYVNIPVSPTSKKQLHYMELEHQEPGAAVRGRGSSKYAQIDITATETAHKVGTQHAQGREEGLRELEQRRRGGPPQ